MLNAQGGIECDLTVDAARRRRLLHRHRHRLRDPRLQLDRAQHPRRRRCPPAGRDLGVRRAAADGPARARLLQQVTADDVSNAALPFGSCARDPARRRAGARAARHLRRRARLGAPRAGRLRARRFRCPDRGGRGRSASRSRAIARSRACAWRRAIAPGAPTSGPTTRRSRRASASRSSSSSDAAVPRPRGAVRQRAAGLKKRLAGFTVDDPEVVLLGRETIYRDGERVGWLTSGGFGYTVGKAIGYGYVRNAAGVDARLPERRPLRARGRDRARARRRSICEPLYDPADDAGARPEPLCHGRGDMTLRLIQLGLGGWGRNWVEEVTRTTPGVEPVAWVELDPAPASAAIADARPAAGAGLRRARGGARGASRPMPRWSRCRSRRTQRRRARRSRPGLHVAGREAVHRRRWPRRRPGRAGARARPRADGQPELPLVPGAAASARSCCATARSASRSPATSTSISCSAAAIATSFSTSRCSATWRSTTSTACASCSTTSRSRGHLHELERARLAVPGPPGGGRDDPLRQRHDRQLPRQLDLARADHALWRPLAHRRHRRHDRVHLPRRLRGAREARPPDPLSAGAARPSRRSCRRWPRKDRMGALAAFAQLGRGRARRPRRQQRRGQSEAASP